MVYRELKRFPNTYLTTNWVADNVLYGGSEAWPFEVNEVRNSLRRLERRGLVKKVYRSIWSSRSIGWQIK
jgi:uncharacterized protein (UPF0297 family)